MASVKLRGNFKNTEAFLKRSLNKDYMSILHKYGKEGVDILASATPIDSGATARSWDYDIKESYKSGVTIFWTNSNVVDDVSIAIILQYGHGTRNGGYVEGRDYINPVMQPLFDKIAEDLWREVIR